MVAELLLPRIHDTLNTQEVYTWTIEVLNKWIVDYFGEQHGWEWVNKLNMTFRLLGHKSQYMIRRNGKWFEVYYLG
jgi:hypothetical protein